MVKTQRNTVFVVPLDKIDHPKSDNVRISYFLSGLKESYIIKGVERISYFDTDNTTLRALRFIGYSIKSIWQGIKFARKIDVIFTQHVAFSTLGALVAIITRKPLICDIDEGNILCHCRVTNSSWIFTRVSLVLEKIIGNAATVLVVPSEYDLILYANQNFKYQNKLTVIPSGIETKNIFHISENVHSLRKRLGLPVDKKILIYMGKRDYYPNKEAAFWINDQLAPILAQRFQDVRILIGGSGEVPTKVHPIIDFIGYVPNIYEYICASDICIVPYKLDTGISLKVLDAMACSKPVVTMKNVSKLFSHVVDGENIVIANGREDFPEKVIFLLQNMGLWARIGSNGKKLVEQHYNWEAINRTWKTLVESAIKS